MWRSRNSCRSSRRRSRREAVASDDFLYPSRSTLMMYCSHWAVLAAALAATGAPGQEKDEKSPPATRPDANVVEIRFADDSTVKMVLQHNSLEVATRYGKLTVPVAEMRRIEFGLRIPEETARRID